jgi:hypothetical protein
MLEISLRTMSIMKAEMNLINEIDKKVGECHYTPLFNVPNNWTK